MDVHAALRLAELAAQPERARLALLPAGHFETVGDLVAVAADDALPLPELLLVALVRRQDLPLLGEHRHRKLLAVQDCLHHGSGP